MGWQGRNEESIWCVVDHSLQVHRVTYTFSAGSQAITIALSPLADTEVWHMKGPAKVRLDKSENYNLRSPWLSHSWGHQFREPLELGRKTAFYSQSHRLSGSTRVLIYSWMVGARLYFNFLLTFPLSFPGGGRWSFSILSWERIQMAEKHFPSILGPQVGTEGPDNSSSLQSQ